MTPCGAGTAKQRLLPPGVRAQPTTVHLAPVLGSSEQTVFRSLCQDRQLLKPISAPGPWVLPCLWCSIARSRADTMASLEDAGVPPHRIADDGLRGTPPRFARPGFPSQALLL